MVKLSMNKLTVGEGVPPHSGISLPNVSLKAKFAASDTSSSIDIPLGIAAKLLTVGMTLSRTLARRNKHQTIELRRK